MLFVFPNLFHFAQGFHDSSVGKESEESNCLQCRIPQFDFWVGKIRWRRDRLPTPVFLGFPGGSAGKESACNAGDLGLIPGLVRSPGEGNGNPLQYSCLENLMDRGAWQATVPGVTESRTQLSNFTSTCFTLHNTAKVQSMLQQMAGFPSFLAK